MWDFINHGSTLAIFIGILITITDILASVITIIMSTIFLFDWYSWSAASALV